MFIAGCGQLPERNPLNLSESTDCRLVTADGSYECRFDMPAEDLCSMTFRSPEAMKGIKISTDGESCTIARGSLICRSGKSLLPENSVMLRAIGCMEKIKNDKVKLKTEKNSDGSYKLCPDSGASDWEIRTDKDGNLTEMILK